MFDAEGWPRRGNEHHIHLKGAKFGIPISDIQSMERAVKRLSLARLLAVVLAPSLGFSMMIVTSDAARAYELPCGGFNHTNIDYFISDNDLTTQLHGAAEDWNDAQNHIDFNEVNNASNRDFKLRATNLGQFGWVGKVHPEGQAGQDFSTSWCNSNGFWKHQTMAATVNTAYQQNSDNKRRGTAVHELGHMLILAHNTDSYGVCGTGGPDFKSIMYPSTALFEGGCAKFVPTLVDKADVGDYY